MALLDRVDELPRQLLKADLIADMKGCELLSVCCIDVSCGERE
ncbi:hypothetical protein ACFCX0_31435 [Streptomyces sp. NPDC056352]